MTTVEGVDWSADPPDLAALHYVGKQFAIRYVGVGSARKLLTPIEAASLTRHGLSIVCVAEAAAKGLMAGPGVGRGWARSGYDHALACGMPPDRPVYLAVDWDCTNVEWRAVREALRAAGNEIGPHLVGVYGSHRVIDWAYNEGVASWFWQTYAWSDHQMSAHAHIHQWRNDVSLVGGTVDLDTALVADYGQWIVHNVTEEGLPVTLTSDQAEKLELTSFTSLHCYGTDGQPTVPLHVWTAQTNDRLAALSAQVGALADALFYLTTQPRDTASTEVASESGASE